ncbi:MAG: C25 family cysteine peptidase [Candidatus Thermoplasmatota archaeon]
MKRIIAAIVVFAMLSVFFGEVKSEDKSINYKVLRYTFPYGTKIKNIDIVPLNVKVTNPINKKFISFRADNFKGDKFFMEYEFPQKWYEYSIGVGIDKGERCIFLTIYFYNTIFSGKKFLHAKDFDIKIDYVLPEKIESLATYDFLIISPDEWINELEALKQHKESKGIKTIVVGLNEIYSGKYFSSYGRDDAEKIKYFIKNAIEEWGIKYVLLVGGRAFGYKERWIMPVRYAYAIDYVPPFTENEFISDLYFADIYKYENGSIVFEDWDSNGNGIFAEYNYEGRYDKIDLMPDIYVGRVACRSKTEVRNVIKKSIEYENSVKTGRILLCGGDTDTFDKEDVNEGEYLNEMVANLMNDFECIKLKASDGSLNRKNIWKEIMKGVDFIDFSGHGSPNSWATHPHNSEEWIGITIFDIFTYFNRKLPIIFANACHTAQFNLTYDCFGWQFLKKKNGAAVAFIGSTGLSYGLSGYNTSKTLSGYLELEFFKNYYNAEFLADMFYGAIKNYIIEIPLDDWQDYKTLEEYILFGIPCLQIK